MKPPGETWVLGIETSCDETAAAVVACEPSGRGRILSDIIRSQWQQHRPFGGIVPEIAARAHTECLDIIIEQAMRDAAADWPSLDAVAATAGPGLIGGLIVGLTTAKAIALVHGIPLVAVNHLEAHALTVGYRASLTEIVQIIGRATRDAPGKTRARFTNLIAEPDASEESVVEAVNDTLKAIAASLLMEQVLAPRFEFKPKSADNAPTPGFDYGEGGYDPDKSNVGVNPQTGQVQIEIKGLAEPRSKEAARICQEDLNEVIATFIQDKTAIERGLFDEELVPEELTQVRMGKIIKEKYPNLDADDQEAVRQHAIAALTLTQQAKQLATGGENDEATPNTALIEGVRRFAMDVRELDIDLIDRINPFGEACAILAKAMSENTLKQVAAAISAKRANLTPEEAKELAVRAVQFKKERGRVPALDSQDAWERRMAEGAAAFMRYRKEGRYE